MATLWVEPPLINSNHWIYESNSFYFSFCFATCSWKLSCARSFLKVLLINLSSCTTFCDFSYNILFELYDFIMYLKNLKNLLFVQTSFASSSFNKLYIATCNAVNSDDCILKGLITFSSRFVYVSHTGTSSTFPRLSRGLYPFSHYFLWVHLYCHIPQVLHFYH